MTLEPTIEELERLLKHKKEKREQLKVKIIRILGSTNIWDNPDTDCETNDLAEKIMKEIES